MPRALAFGPFRLDTGSGMLLHGAEPLPLGQRAVAVLRILLDRAGAPVTKEALIAAAWPGLAVEDSNLTVQVAALRRMLDRAEGGGAWIETLPRRGYRYAGPAPATAPDTPAAHALPDIPSLGVLRLAASDDGTALSAALEEGIVAALSRIKGLFVVARGSSAAIEGDARGHAGRLLGVRYLLEGSLRQQDRRLRLALRLIEAATGRLVWAERLDRDADDLFALEDDVVLAVVGALLPGLRRAEVERARRSRPESLDAYGLVMRALPDMDTGMPGPVRQGLALVERALAQEPGYALAHGCAAMCHHCLFLRDGLSPAHRDAALQHARSAIAHGQDDALALALAGFSLGMDGHDRAAAAAAFEQALAISPSTAMTHILGSVVLGWSGERARAVAWAETGLRLSPFDPWSFAALHGLMLGRFLDGEVEAACVAAYRAVQANPGHSISHMLLAAALSRAGRLPEAKAAASRVLALQPGFRIGRQLSGVACDPVLARALKEALLPLGLPH